MTLDDTAAISSNTKVVLLLTAPLIVGRSRESMELLTPGEFSRLLLMLRDIHREPADLIGPEAPELAEECRSVVDPERLRRLTARGLLLGQALEHWRARSIWVVSCLDDAYPSRLLERLGNKAPPVLYGCGDATVLESGGLAVVGSRDVTADLTEYTESIGGLAARSGRTVISGGARGIDQAAMRGALEADGRVAGVLADSLERSAIAREHRVPFMDGNLALVSPYDPMAGFNAGNAMQRNKLIYALADAALVVSSDYEKGGTWTGAVEQLEKFRAVPVYVRSRGEMSPGLEALRRKGGLAWPEPETPSEFSEALTLSKEAKASAPTQQGFTFSFGDAAGPSNDV